MRVLNKTFISIFFILAGLSVSSPLFSQSYQSFRAEIAQIAEKARWKIGPFSIYPTLRLNNIGYDDNVYRMQEEDNPISDYTATISPQVTAYLTFRDWFIFSFLESPGYAYYMKEKKERAFNHSYSPTIRMLLFHRFVLTGSYQYQRAKRRGTPEFDLRVFQKTRSYQARLFYETSRGTTFGLSHATRDISYEDVTLPDSVVPISTALNRRENINNFECYYRIFSESTLFFNVGYVDYKFKSSESKGLFRY